MRATWDIQTPVGAAGAVAIFQLCAESPAGLDAALHRLGLPPLAVGRIARHSLLSVDDGLVARWSPTCAQLMPHGGPAVVQGIADTLVEAGFLRRWVQDDPMAEYPEARSEVEARMLGALSQATSPRAIDLLLDQPRRWLGVPADAAGVTDPALDRIRNRLLHPPLVVAIGPPNVGKSTLVNALAGRGVSITADQPGTTRDHVGVELDLDGVTVYYVDTPGLHEPVGKADRVQFEAQALARLVAARADLVLLCGDGSWPDPRPLLGKLGRAVPVLTVALRADLGPPAWAFDASVSGLHEPGAGSRAGGLERLVGLIARTLVPSSALNDPRPWRFWG